MIYVNTINNRGNYTYHLPCRLTLSFAQVVIRMISRIKNNYLPKQRLPSKICNGD